MWADCTCSVRFTLVCYPRQHVNVCNFINLLTDSHNLWRIKTTLTLRTVTTYGILKRFHLFKYSHLNHDIYEYAVFRYHLDVCWLNLNVIVLKPA